MQVNGKIQLYPLFRVVLFLILGIWMGDLSKGSIPPHGWLGGYALVLCVAWFVRRRAIGQTIMVFLSVFLLGGFLITQKERRLSVEIPSEEELYKAVVVSVPEEKGKTIRCDLWIVTGRMSGYTVRASILKDTIERRYQRIGIGDGLLLASVLKSPRNFSDSNFDYVRYLHCHGIVAQTFVYWCNWRKVRVSLRDLSVWERTRLSAMRLRQHLLEQYQAQEIGGQSLAVVAAMTLGDKSLLSKETKEAFSISGTTHVLALSGLHLSVIYMLFSLFRWGRRRHWLEEVIVLSAVWAYTVMVGMSPSVTRAAIMITIYSLIGLLNRDHFSLNSLSLAAIIMLIVNPLNLYDVGFQLSFMAVLFIMLWYSPLYGLVSTEWLWQHRAIKWLWSMTVLSFSAQIGTTPLIIYYFGRFSLYTLMANYLVIPAVSVILFLALFLLLTTSFPAVSCILAYLLTHVVELLNAFLTWMTTLPYACFDGIDVNSLQVTMMYVALCSLYLLYMKVYQLYIKQVKL